MAGMTASQPALADMLASLHHSAKAEGAAARARLDVIEALFLALLATLFGRLERLAAGFTPRTFPRAQPGSLPHSPYAVPHNTPGPRRARHRGPVPPRAFRLGRFTPWWTRNRGPRAIPSQAPKLRPARPARAPPLPLPHPISRQNTPQPGCASARP